MFSPKKIRPFLLAAFVLPAIFALAENPKSAKADGQTIQNPQMNGFTALFNGKDLTGWKGLVADPIKRSKMDAKTLAAEQVKADAEMRDSWKVVNGELQFVGHGNNITTVKKYGDFEMMVDWKIIDDGKQEGDAGIYLRGTPQVQI
jgi:hypothetical protein